ncbi:MAG: hypothetical protein P8Y99_12880 [Calditrichaceae bacterium]
MINVQQASLVSGSGLFIYLTQDGGNIFSARITGYVRQNESTNQIAFGISKNSGIASTSYDYDLNTTYLIVMKYTFDAEESDQVALWVDPNLMEPETTPDATTVSGTDLSEIANIILSQLTASNNPPDAVIDGIKITTTWNDIPSAIDHNSSDLFEQYALMQNYPNPFNPTTTPFVLTKHRFIHLQYSGPKSSYTG